MIKKYIFGTPIETEAVITTIPECKDMPEAGIISLDNGFSWTYTMADDDIVYGLGEANRGINKRGYIYVNNCNDEPLHTEDLESLYAAHNFIVLSGRRNMGLFFDYPAKITFDIGYSYQDTLTVCCEGSDLTLYIIDGTSALDVIRQFRKIIGRSYIPPKFAFGFGQSRWGYKTEKDFKDVVEGYRSRHIPLDMVYMDIDYMEDYKDFTVNPQNFPDFEAFVKDMKASKIHLVPIIDAGVKIEDGYSIYEEGKAGGYFCKRKDGSDFAATVWPGRTHFPDVLNTEARQWFGSKYKVLTDAGIDGFWNDMNEPAIFYSDEGMDDLQAFLKDFAAMDPEEIPQFLLNDKVNGIKNSPRDYAAFYHDMDGIKVRHDKVHNLYGYYMTRAAGEAFDRICPGRRVLMFSRSSYIGMHRYGGVWTGDNKSWWSHLLLNIKMMPSLNMCGFLYTGADLGGFSGNTTRDLLLRWLAFGVFTPLMRDHSALGTREQECYRFERPEDFRHVISVRYRLIPYLYSEFMKAALNDDLYFKPLAFAYPDDPMATSIEDQLILGNEVMVTPVYTQNAPGRYVYLPEEMLFVKFMPDGSIFSEIMAAGHHYIQVALNEVPLFVRKGHCIPLAAPAETVDAIDTRNLDLLGYEGATYTLYDDDGVSKDYDLAGHYKTYAK